MSDKPKVLFVHFVPKLYDPDALSRVLARNTQLEFEDADLQPENRRPLLSTPKAASIIVDSMEAVAQRFKEKAEPVPCKVLVYCPPLIEFIEGNPGRKSSWVPVALKHAIGAQYAVFFDRIHDEEFSLPELLPVEGAGAVPADTRIFLLGLRIEKK